MATISMGLAARWAALYDAVYERYTQVIIVPVLMLVLALGVLGMSYAQDGAMLDKGIDFTGGTSIQFQVNQSVTTEQVAPVFGAGATVRTMTGDGRWIIVETTEEFSQQSTEALRAEIGRRLDEADVAYHGEISVQSLGASVGEAFFRDAQIWSGIGLLLMSVVIFVAFRSLVPSLAVIFAALTDIVFAMAGMAVLGIDLTLGSLAALLMLLGYSVDTDILLSTRVLKQHEQDLKDRIEQSIMTGSTMTVAAIAAFTMLYLVSTSPTLDQIAAVIIIGLAADLPVTWLGNAAILKYHVRER